MTSPGVLLALALAAAQTQSAVLRNRMLAAEDARASTADGMAPLLQGLRATDPQILLQAVRGLGRFERPGVVPQLMPFLSHPRPAVRAEAANALAQSLYAVPRSLDDPTALPPQAQVVTNALIGRLRIEVDPYVAGVLAESLGRLPFRSTAAIADVEAQLAALLPVAEGSSRAPATGEPVGRVMHPATIGGAVKGLETRIRVHQKLAPIQPATLARLQAAATLGSDPSDADLAYVRRVAWMAINQTRGAGLELVDRGLEDPDPQVRRLAVVALGNVDAAAPERISRLERALRDSSFMVRHDAVRGYSRSGQTSSCAPLLTAIDDPSPHVSLAAIDALGGGCPAGPNPIPTLLQLVDGARRSWHRPAHAFVSLARLAPDHAASRMVRFAASTIWQVRMYAARAAAHIPAPSRLERLAHDAHDNVREAAISSLMTVRGHASDDVYVAALGRGDYQLLRTAALALKGSPNGGRAIAPLAAAFERITAERLDTSRDTRLALLDRLQEFGTRANVRMLQPCLDDFDPVVARRCAEVLTSWSGTAHAARPVQRPPAPVASFPAHRQARITMQSGGAFDIRLFSDLAPATVARFARLARQGYYNGLTFHRVVPNFVIQGGSPGANEYMGDGPFMRDEVGLRTHARGTLGISTRGRDTGDAQIFINLVDNPRLDHTYTVFGEVTVGMDVVDRIVEGDVMARVDVLEPASSQSRR